MKAIASYVLLTTLLLLFASESSAQEIISPSIFNCDWEIYVGFDESADAGSVSATNVGGPIWGAAFDLTDSISGSPFYAAYSYHNTTPEIDWPNGFDFINSISNHSCGQSGVNAERYLPYSLVRIDFFGISSTAYSIYLDLRDDRYQAPGGQLHDIYIRLSESSGNFDVWFDAQGSKNVVAPGDTFKIYHFIDSTSTSNETKHFQPTSPQNLAVAWNSDDTHPELTWTASLPSSALYRIYRRLSTSGTYTVIDSAFNTTVYIDSSIGCNSGTYYYRVQGVSGDSMKLSPTYSQYGPFETSPCIYTVNGEKKKNAPDLLTKRLLKTKSLSDIDTSGVVFWPNNIRAFLWDIGIYFNDLNTGTSGEGLFWPGNTNKNLVYTAGPWIAGKDEKDSVRSSVSYDFSEYQPGRILAAFADTNMNAADNIHDTRFRIMMLSDTSSPQSSDYQNWVRNASVTGAPLKSDGTPLLLGNLNAYWVMNDLDATAYDSIGWYSRVLPNLPMGVEIQNYVFGFDDAGDLSNAIYIVLKIINRSVHTYDSTYVGWFNDIDLGNANDDVPGCDTLLSLGYMYNGTSPAWDDSDTVYGKAPPACGFVVLNAPHRASSGEMMGSFFSDGNIVGWDLPSPGSTSPTEIRNVLSGKFRSGAPITLQGNPTVTTTYPFSGDPVTNTGWVAPYSGDMHNLIGLPSFTFPPGDTEYVALAFVVGQGTDRLNSITELKAAVPNIVSKWNAVKSALVNVNETKPILPTEFSMSEGYPNPFNPSTTFRIMLPERSRVSIKVYDILGSEVRQLISGEYDAGMRQVVWDGRNGKGQTCSSGVYYTVVRVTPVTGSKAGFTTTRKVVLMK